MDPAQKIEAAALAQQRPMLEAMANAKGDSEIQRFYRNSVLFFTGGSGFMGKYTIEKLMRSCQISEVYVLLRPKKGKDIQSRLLEMVKDPVFDTLREQKPEFADKLLAIEGDVAELGLGINDKDWATLTEQVDVIFHMAATTRFDEPLRTATLINIRGTREALLLGKSCKKLRSFVHVSTAYTNATTTLAGKDIHESFYKSPVPPDAMISMAETMEPERLDGITPSLIKSWPNTYTFTKSVSEELVREMSSGLPICVVRPGIVACTYREPSPGWLDNSCVYGATGYFVGLGLGLLHTSHQDSDVVLGVIPCDFVNNAIIVAASETSTSQDKGGENTKIYHMTSTQRNPVAWKNFVVTIKNEARTIVTPKAIYYCFGLETPNKFIYMLLCLFWQFIPAYIADFVCLLIGKQRRFVKMSSKIYKMCEVLSFFSMREWKFVDNNTFKLLNNLSENDKAIFNFDVAEVDWKEYLLVWAIGVRKYILKDGLIGSEAAQKKQIYLRIFHYIFTAFYVYALYKLSCLVVYCLSQLFFVFKLIF